MDSILLFQMIIDIAEARRTITLMRNVYIQFTRQLLLLLFAK